MELVRNQRNLRNYIIRELEEPVEQREPEESREPAEPREPVERREQEAALTGRTKGTTIKMHALYIATLMRFMIYDILHEGIA